MGKIGEIIEMIGMGFAAGTVEKCCIFWFHQPEEPKGLKKIKKIKREED